MLTLKCQTSFLESHDAARSVSRFGDGNPDNRFKIAKLLAMLQTTLGGTLYVHQGQEIGMANLAYDIPIEAYVDIETKGFLQDMLRTRQAAELGRVIEMDEIVQEVADQVRLKARDHGRMPMPWDNTKPYAGFSDATDNTQPWTRMNSDSAVCNVADQESDANSVLNFWKRMLSFRRAHSDTLGFGDFEPSALDNGPVFAYHRKALVDEGAAADNMLMVLNLTNQDKAPFTLPASTEGDIVDYTVMQCTSPKGAGGYADSRYNSREELGLSPYEGLILACGR